MIDDARFFKEMTLRICGSLDISEALASCFDYIREHMPVDAIGLGYHNLRESEGSELAKIKILAKAALDPSHYVWDASTDELLLSRALIAYTHTRETAPPTANISNNPSDQPREMHDLFPGLAHSSVVFMRLELSDGVIGALLVSVRGHGAYTQEHATLLESIREPLAIAMLNARRYTELEELKDRLAQDNRALTEDIKHARGARVIGADFGLKHVMNQVRQIAKSSSPTLLLGETGTGKEVIANAIHTASPRGGGPLVFLQCGAVPEQLLDSELFGHERGAFTGAFERKRGRFERAHGGTLFLDEIGELSLDAQVKLLRVLQERKFERVGGVETLEADVRVIAATHRDLEAMVREGTFREDLWYRLSVLPIRIPPLRLRRGDIPSLVQHFIELKAREMNLAHKPRVDAQDLQMLTRYDWPGNVRELQNIVERALILSNSEALTFPRLDPPASSPILPTTPSNRFATLDDTVRAHILAALDRTKWRISGPKGAAKLLDMHPNTLRFRMKKLGIDR